MFGGFGAYPGFLTSPIGPLPDTWDIRRLRTVTKMLVSNVDKLTKDDESPVRLCNYVDVYKRDIITPDQPFMAATASSDEINAFRLRAGDVVITKDSESFNDIAVPAYVAADADDLVCGYHLAILRPGGEILGRYLFWALRVPAIAHQFHIAAGGVTRFGLSHEDIKSVWLPVPSADEQAAIVKYLTHANARIDKAIAAKRRLIALLQEQAVAEAEAVLDEVARDAPLPLLGRVLRRVEQGMSPTAAEGDLIDGQWAVLTLSAVSRGNFVRGALKPVEPELDVPHGLELHDGDLLMTRSNTRERVGDVAVVRDVRPRTFMSDLIYRLVPRADLLNAEYASWALRSRRARAQIEASARGSSDTMPKLAQSHIKALRMPLPELAAQAQAVERINEMGAPIRAAVERATAEVALLLEFRTRLTADVVTGQVDVREIAASLPEVEPGASGWETSGGDAADVEELAEMVGADGSA